MTHSEELHVVLKDFPKILDRNMLNAALGNHQDTLRAVSETQDLDPK